MAVLALEKKTEICERHTTRFLKHGVSCHARRR
jgi:hypothetical protein